MRVIRKIVNEQPNEFWTGTGFDSDINRAMEIRGGRHASIEKRKALKIANESKSVSQKTEKVVFTLGYFDSTEDATFTESYQSKRNSQTKGQVVDATILRSDGNLDGPKVSELMLQRHLDKRLEAQGSIVKSVALSRAVTPEKK